MERAITQATRRKLIHPLDRHPEEVMLWVYDERFGSLSQLARARMGLPGDTFCRALWRLMISMEYSVLAMTVKSRRRMYLLMRGLIDPRTGDDLDDFVDSVLGGNPAEPPAAPDSQLRCPHPTQLAAAASDYLVPSAGMTMGQLSAFHILLTRTQFTKSRHLEEHIDALGMGINGSVASSRPVVIDHRLQIDYHVQ